MDPEKIRERVEKGELLISEGHKKIEEIATARSRPRQHGGPLISTSSKKGISEKKKTE